MDEGLMTIDRVVGIITAQVSEYVAWEVRPCETRRAESEDLLWRMFVCNGEIFLYAIPEPGKASRKDLFQVRIRMRSGERLEADHFVFRHIAEMAFWMAALFREGRRPPPVKRPEPSVRQAVRRTEDPEYLRWLLETIDSAPNKRFSPVSIISQAIQEMPEFGSDPDLVAKRLVGHLDWNGWLKRRQHQGGWRTLAGLSEEGKEKLLELRHESGQEERKAA